MFTYTDKTPALKFKHNNTTFVVPVNKCVPANGNVTVLAKFNTKVVDEGTANPAIMLYVKCNTKSREVGRIYALFYNLRTKQFDGHFTVN